LFKRIKQIKFNSIRFKVSLFYMALLGAILIFYTAILFFGQRFAFYRDLDRELAIKAQEIAGAINSFLPVLENDQRAFRLAADMAIRQEQVNVEQEKITDAQKQWLAIRTKLDIRDDYIVLANTKGDLVTCSRNIDKELQEHLLKNIAAAVQKTVAYQEINVGPHKLRMITIPYYYKNKRMYLIAIGTSRVPMLKILYGSLFFALFAIPIILIFTSFLGGLITERILGPVMLVTNIAKNITYKDLRARVEMKGVDQELTYLVDAFNEMISRLDKSFRYIDEFSSNVAHELKTPLTIISGESELALMQERDIEEYKRVIDVNLREAGQLLRIVEDLLLLSKLEHKPEAFKFEEVDLTVFLEEILEQAKRLALPKNINVSLELPDQPVNILVDWLHFRRLFINLLDNAVKFSAQDGKITIAAKLKAEKIFISVSDTGMGIASGNLDKIFHRFFRIDYAGQADKSGSGLGLSIAHSIAKIHRGDISVSSQLGKGSTFTVILTSYSAPLLP
jgi:heavy metal sensor kinase